MPRVTITSGARLRLARAFGTLSVLAFASACSDRNPVGRAPAIAGPTGAATYARVTPAELRRRNPMSFVGEMNTEFMKKTTAKMIATKKLPRTKDLCGEATRFFATHKRAEWTGLPAAVRQRALGSACETLRPLGNTKPRGQIRGVASFQEHDPDYDVGTDFHVAVDNMVTQGSQASDLTDLASRYAVILSSTQGMRWIDSIGVEVMLGLAMSQAEYFWDGSVLQSYINQVSAEYEACRTGTGTDVYIELDPGRTLECENGQMWETRKRGAPSRSAMQFALYDPVRQPVTVFNTWAPAPLPDCNATMGQRVWRAFGWAMGGGAVGFTAGSVAGAIAGAGGGVAGAIAGAKAGGATGGAVGVIVGGLAGVIYQAGDYTYCQWAT